ncbi:hypothetical protein IH992_18275 [Candidatus Poribacteria bacterium]|nr:hypothetical protein [Candidatus Poribacteria bacterium]
MPQNRLKTKLLSFLLLSVMLISVRASAQQYQQPSRQTQSPRRQRQAEVYHESALRRFEIITLVALPFTAMHSFLAMRGVKMIQKKEFAPELTGTDFKIIGATAVSFALFIGLWDWMHTHDKNASEQLMSPSSSPSTPPLREAKADDWKIEDSSGFVLPLVQVRF